MKKYTNKIIFGIIILMITIAVLLGIIQLMISKNNSLSYSYENVLGLADERATAIELVNIHGIKYSGNLVSNELKNSELVTVTLER